MPAVQLNTEQFNSRLKHLLDAWNSAGKNDEYESISGADGLLLSAGDPAGPDEPMKKGVAFQTWLLGFEFPSTLILFRKDHVTILTSASKAKILAQLQSAHPIVPIQILAQAKAKEPPTDALPTFTGIYTNLKRVGIIAKDNTSGKLIDDWHKDVSEAQNKPETVDMSGAISAILAVKDEEELKCTRIASNLTSTLMNHHIAPKLETILDRESKITHETFAAQIEARLGSGEGENAKGPDMKIWSKGRGLSEVDWDSTEFCYAPIIQSRGTKSGYDLRSSAESSSDMMEHKGVLLVAVGMRYKGYCANVGRTFVVDPTKEQEAVYSLLVSLQAELLSKMKDGVIARDVYMHAISYIREKRPELEKHFVKNAGFSMGMEFRDSHYLLSPKCSRPLKTNMVFNLALGYTDLDDADGNKYSMLLTDTVKVDHEKGICLTDCIKSSKDVLFFLNTGSDEEEEKEKTKSSKKPPVKPLNGVASPAKHKVAGGKVLRNKTRGAAQDDVIQTTAARIAEHQRELHAQRQAEGLARYSEEGQGTGTKEGKGWKRFQSYKGEAGLPKEVEILRILVDRKAQTVVLPMNGFAVPMHINAIKNASKNDEGEYTYLRINFQSPGQLAGKKEDTPFEDPDATFIRSITYRSVDVHRFDSVLKQITELKKEVNKREQHKKEMADVIEQDVLVELKTRRPHKLPEVFVRPATDGKRMTGEVEIHQNGLRYHTSPQHKIDILFSNIKHLFFQPCDHELLVIIHIHLKSPIMIGKRKAKDVQFYREASDVQFDETGNRKRKYRYGDEDEIELEQQERKRRQALNKEFKSFAEKIAEASTQSTGDPLEADIPFRELAFEGVPFRTNVKLQPTTECLVHLSDSPFLVVTLSEIEIASLERVQWGLKQFDMVLVFTDFTRSPLQINSIPSSQLDDVKNWLDSVDIPLAESPVNLNWGPIMKTINESPYDFFQQGGWSFLRTGTGEDEEESESESESEFAADTDELVESESEDSGSEFDDSASDDSGSASSFDEDESSGDDWDELEKKAEKADKKRATNGKRRDSDDSGSDRQKKNKAKIFLKSYGDPVTHNISVLGILSPGSSDSHSQAIVRIERTALSGDFSKLLRDRLENVKLIESTDIYSWLLAWFTKHQDVPDAKINIICPATEVHIRKYSSQSIIMVQETPELYEKIVKPFIQAFPPSRTHWVENILTGVSEAEKVLYRDDSPEAGFLIVPDMKWDLANTSTLYLVALSLNRKIRSLRDLNRHHLPMLKNIRREASRIVKERWGLEKGSLRFYVHYQPSYYHFHVHIVNSNYVGFPGMNVGQAHLLEDLISLIELGEPSAPCILKRMTLSYGLGDQHGLFEKMKSAQENLEQ
ncbi:FACT complex subunit SPT16 [Sanghuangporus baumii]|uniref:FACT complex subunit n=1 Tax=Sanghuangporus baumii TaxID=108892 RepID=A0A9Q5HQN2_SANBA|nr:FACT complex subunit SPT16 [Sanghuangporus baumii]